MSAARIIKPGDFKPQRPDPEQLRQVAKELMGMEADEHLSDNPRWKGIQYISLSMFARDQLVRWLTQCADYIENPQGNRLMLRGGKHGFRIGG